ncbi:MAG: undecaprenyl-diphosphate phosphatase [Patescibacteria group bacterium]
MNILDAVILGVVEGITEFLPVSSTAHLILAGKVLGLADSEFLKSFEIIIQVGAIFAVLTLFYKKFFDIEVLKKVIAGFIPTALLGLVFYKTIKNYLGDISVVLGALFIGGIVMIVFEKWHSRKFTSLPASTPYSLQRENLTLTDCVKIGLFQSIAFIPGVSRSAATIVGGMSLGISRAAIVEYSFLLAVPTMIAATGLDAFKNRAVILHSGKVSLLIVGLLISYIVALFAIKSFLSYIRKKDFVPFGIYRIAIALLFLLFVY